MERKRKAENLFLILIDSNKDQFIFILLINYFLFINYFFLM